LGNVSLFNSDMVRNYKRKTERVYVRDGYYTNISRAERKANPKTRGRPRKLPDAPTDTAVAAWEAFRRPIDYHYFPVTQF